MDNCLMLLFFYPFPLFLPLVSLLFHPSLTSDLSCSDGWEIGGFSGGFGLEPLTVSREESGCSSPSSRSNSPSFHIPEPPLTPSPLPSPISPCLSPAATIGAEWQPKQTLAACSVSLTIRDGNRNTHPENRRHRGTEPKPDLTDRKQK